MIEIKKSISPSEINSKYLNVDFPTSFPFKEDEEFWLIDRNGEKFLATRHTKTQITGLTKWFKANQILESVEIKLSYDKNELIDKKRVLHFEFLNKKKTFWQKIIALFSKS
jgi:hypothetical protein